MQRLLQLGIELRISYAFCGVKTRWLSFQHMDSHRFVFLSLFETNLNVHAGSDCHLKLV